MERKEKKVLQFDGLMLWLHESLTCFLVNIYTHLNNLNLQFQGKYQLVHNLCKQIKAFEMKVHLWEDQIRKETFQH